MNEINLTKEQISYLLSPRAIRERTYRIYELCQKGETHFSLHLEKMPALCYFVLDVIKDNYPDLNIPFHSRWGHFQVGGIDRVGALEKLISESDDLERARSKIDLVITSVLLDAGAGMKWSYRSEYGTYSKSEGLAVASYDMFLAKKFATNEKLQADAQALMKMSAQDIVKAFQVSEKNPMVGVEGRAVLLQNLGKVLAAKKEIFKDGRPGNILDYLISQHGMSFEVSDILNALLLHLGDIWPGRLMSQGTHLGDVWKYNGFGASSEFESLVPFHKLSQWLTYSLVEPIEQAGVSVTGAEKLTGLAEYRNGGLFLDRGVIALRDQALLTKAHRPESDLIIEWRALTIALLDQVGDSICKSLGKLATEFPLAKVLEGGTWHAGRRVAKELRTDGGPPLNLESDGTVF